MDKPIVNEDAYNTRKTLAKAWDTHRYECTQCTNWSLGTVNSQGERILC